MVAANDAQRERLAGARDDDWAALCAERSRPTPGASSTHCLEKIASYVAPDDVLLDVGGGAGRLSLPLALRCREVIIVDPSAGMRRVFEADSGGRRHLQRPLHSAQDWLMPKASRAMLRSWRTSRTSFREIVPFIEKLNAATRRRVIVAYEAYRHPTRSRRSSRWRTARDARCQCPGHERAAGRPRRDGHQRRADRCRTSDRVRNDARSTTREDADRRRGRGGQRDGLAQEEVRPERLAALIERALR